MTGVQTCALPISSRGGEKLASAIERTPISALGKRCLDVGASTGGFTDYLLQHGATHVVAVDVGYGQIIPRLRDDPRVEVREREDAGERRVRPPASCCRP